MNSSQRATIVLHGLPVHEELLRDFDAAMRVTLAEKIEEGDLPPPYFSHPFYVNRLPGQLWLPIGLFIDGVPYSQTDSLIGVWVVNLATMKRYYILGVRKKMLCSCGCRGWCTLYHLFIWLRWSFRVGKTGRMPSVRHDDTPFQDDDMVRSSTADNACLLFMVIFLKFDWMEICTTLGFPNWRDGLRPCFACNASVDSLYQFLRHGLRTVPGLTRPFSS